MPGVSMVRFSNMTGRTCFREVAEATEGLIPLVGLEWGRGGFVMVNPSVRRLRVRLQEQRIK